MNFSGIIKIVDNEGFIIRAKRYYSKVQCKNIYADWSLNVIVQRGEQFVQMMPDETENFDDMNNKEKDDFVRENTGKIPVKEMSKKMGISQAAVYIRQKKLAKEDPPLEPVKKCAFERPPTNYSNRNRAQLYFE